MRSETKIGPRELVRFIIGKFGVEIFEDAEPDITKRLYYVGRDMRLIPPASKPELVGYHSRFFLPFMSYISSIQPRLPDILYFTKSGEKDAEKLHLTIRQLCKGECSFTNALEKLWELGFATQASVSYMKSTRAFGTFSGEVIALEKIMIEFEPKSEGRDMDKVKTAVQYYVDCLSSYVTEPFIMFSGNKSYYVIVYLPRPIKDYPIYKGFRLIRKLGPKEIYHGLFRALTDGLTLECGDGFKQFIDPQVNHADVLLRLPGSPHEDTGMPAMAVDVNLKPMEFSADIMEKAVISESLLVVGFAYATPAPEVPRRHATGGEPGRELPNWVIQLIEYLKSTGELCHFARLAVAEWLLYKAYKEKGTIDDGDIEAITDIFRKYASDFNERITKYQIKYAWESWISKGGKPLRCETVVEKCGNNDVPPLTCE
ncbi:MAG: hypothetical protein ACP5NQ_10090 [Vulcanisaeta sp.]